MKWLRSSLFKDNKDKFVFEEKLDIVIDNFDASFKGVENVIVSGVLTRSGQNKIFVDLNITGNYKVISSRTLNILTVPFNIVEQEEFIDRNDIYGDDYFDINVMDMYIDITDLVNELIIINAPTNFYLDDEVVEKINGKDWTLLSDEDYIVEQKEDNPFSALSDMFKEK